MYEYLIIFLFLFFIIFILLFVIPVYFTNNCCMFYVDNNNLGNMLSDYFYNKLNDSHRFNISHVFLNISDANTKEFIIKVLNYKIDKKIKIKFTNDIWAAKWVHNGKAGYSEFWKHARPIIKDLYDSTLTKITSDYPIIHFRCSDIPFVRNEYYHIPKINYLNDVILELKRRNYNKIIFLNNTSHNSKNYNTCSFIIDIYINYLTENGIEVIYDKGCERSELGEKRKQS